MININSLIANERRIFPDGRIYKVVWQEEIDVPKLKSEIIETTFGKILNPLIKFENDGIKYTELILNGIIPSIKQLRELSIDLRMKEKLSKIKRIYHHTTDEKRGKILITFFERR